MRLLEARHRDIYFIVDFSLKELKNIKVALDTATFAFDGENDAEAKEANEYITKKLYPMIAQLVDESPDLTGVQ